MMRGYWTIGLVVVVSLLVGQSALADHTVVPKGKCCDMSSVVTRGNFSYVPLNLQGTQQQHVSLILDVLNMFESSFLRPVRIESFWFSEDTSNGNWIHGIWIHHVPKETK